MWSSLYKQGGNTQRLTCRSEPLQYMHGGEGPSQPCRAPRGEGCLGEHGSPLHERSQVVNRLRLPSIHLKPFLDCLLLSVIAACTSLLCGIQHNVSRSPQMKQGCLAASHAPFPYHDRARRRDKGMRQPIMWLVLFLSTNESSAEWSQWLTWPSGEELYTLRSGLFCTTRAEEFTSHLTAPPVFCLRPTPPLSPLHLARVPLRKWLNLFPA